MTTFDALGVSADLVAALARAGMTTPLPIQAQTIPDALAGHDVCGKAETGSGKTLAFGIPLIERTTRAEPGRPRALVLVPTRELAGQVRDVLAPLARSRNLRVVAVYGGTSFEPQLKALRRGVEIVIATPGRLIDLAERRDLTFDDVTAVVLDEADRMVDMGFLPQVEWVLRRVTAPHQTLLFSATLDREIDHIVRTYANGPVRHEVASPIPTVEAMEHRFFRVHELDKLKVAAAVAGGARRTLVFVRTKRGADRLGHQFKREGVPVAVLHGGLAQGARQRELSRFREGRVKILVATDVAARGLDIDDVDVVIHYDPPEDHKAYLHRSGRTARAGKTGVAVSLLLWDQVAEADRLRRRLGLAQPLVELFSTDPRLNDLAGPEWKQLEEDVASRDAAEVRPRPRSVSLRSRAQHMGRPRRRR